MKAKLLAPVLAIGTIILGSIVSTSQFGLAQSRQYFCDEGPDGVPTTYTYSPTGRRIAVIRWERDWNVQLSPEDRCDRVSDQYQTAYEKGVLIYITRSWRSGQNVVCAARRYAGACDQMLFTLRAGDDPEVIVERLMGVGSRASGPVVQSEDGSPRSYYSMSTFLETAPTEEE